MEYKTNKQVRNALRDAKKEERKPNEGLESLRFYTSLQFSRQMRLDRYKSQESEDSVWFRMPKEYQDKLLSEKNKKGADNAKYNKELILWIKTQRNIIREDMKINFPLFYSDLCLSLGWEFAEANWDVIFPKKYFKTQGKKLMTL